MLTPQPLLLVLRDASTHDSPVQYCCRPKPEIWKRTWLGLALGLRWKSFLIARYKTEALATSNRVRGLLAEFELSRVV